MAQLLKNPRVLLIGGGIILLVIVIILNLALRSSKNDNSQANGPQSRQAGTGRGEALPTGGVVVRDPDDTNPDPATANTNLNATPAPKKDVVPAGVFAKVGKELLHESDLNYELSFYPTLPGQNPQEIVIAKMIRDSIILQGAADDGLITLDPSIFNSASKDYAKRIETVARARELIEKKSVVLKGTVIAIWFHNMQPGPAGYERGKQIAFAEMNRILSDLQGNRMTMAEAANQIRGNTALAQVDPSYRGNASFDFAVARGQKITFSPEIDAEIFKLSAGQTSGILIGKDLDPRTGQKIDAVYMIARVDEKDTSAVSNFDSWYESKSNVYKVVRY